MSVVSNLCLQKPPCSFLFATKKTVSGSFILPSGSSANILLHALQFVHADFHVRDLILWEELSNLLSTDQSHP